MAPLPVNISLNPLNESSQPNKHHGSKSASETLRDEARIIFDKTIEGHYRHGKTGYRQVGALFLTWEDDDMQCKETEVDKLRQLFEEGFKFQTACFEIPSERWETALHKRLADFCYEYDSPENLAIIYYGGHAYEGTETKEFKLAAKFANDGHGDPTAFFNDIRTCLRLPACDQLVILDCCYAAKAFAREHVGKRKFELLTSAAHNVISPAPKLPHSFTRTLNDAMICLLKDNPNGFSTSHLYREVYHTVRIVKPLLFDQARHSLGKIWLRPQIQDAQPKSEAEGRYLKLTLKLNAQPEGAVMNDLALQLQYLPHVDQVRFEDLYAPKEQITDFMRFVLQTQKLRPLIRRIYARRQLRRVLAMKKGDHVAGVPPSLMKLHLEQNHQPAYDWSSAVRADNHHDTGRSGDQRKKSGTWPPTRPDTVSNAISLPNNQISAEYKVDLPGPGTFVATFVPHGVDTTHDLPLEQANDTAQQLASPRSLQGDDDTSVKADILVASNTAEPAQNGDRRKRPRSQSPEQEARPEKKSHKGRSSES